MAILMVPLRSPTIPARPPKTSGTDRARVEDRIVTSGTTELRPAPAQVRKETTKLRPSSRVIHTGAAARRSARAHRAAVIAPAATTMTTTTRRAGRSRTGIWMRSAPVLSWKRVAPRPKTAMRISRATTTAPMTGALRSRGSSTSTSSTLLRRTGLAATVMAQASRAGAAGVSVAAGRRARRLRDPGAGRR